MKPQPPFVVTFSDLWLICRKKKISILLGLCLITLMVLGFALVRPKSYLAQGSFKEKGKTAAGLPSSNIAAFFNLGSSTANGEAFAILKSHKLLTQLVHELDLQGSITKTGFEIRSLTNIKDNLISEYSSYKNVIGPYFAETPPELSLRGVTYSGESPLTLKILFLDEDRFEVVGEEEASQGFVGKPYVYKEGQFTVHHSSEKPVTGAEYAIAILPLEFVVKSVAGNITIEADKEDKNLLRIKYRNQDRFLAPKVINTLMALYQDYIWKEQQLVMDKQVDYLYGRHDEVSERLRKMMKNHAEDLAKGVAKSGFPDTGTAMAFLAQTRQEYAKQLLAIELEMKRLHQMQAEESFQYLKAQGTSEFAAFNHTLNKIHELKKQADTLDIALRETLLKNPQKELPLPEINTQLAALNSQQELYIEATEILGSLKKGELPKRSYKIIEDPRYHVNVWYDNLMTCRKNSSEWSSCLHYFIAYMANLQRLFQVHSIALEEQLTHQQAFVSEFQGIDLKTAETLYITYNGDLNRVETLMKQAQFIIDRMQGAEFEISSLSNFLDDKVSQEMIANASKLELSMRDRDNRSAKELERGKRELELQKEFLLAHLKQTMHLNALKKEQIEKKLYAIQHTMLALIREEISILDRYLRDHITARINNLAQEQLVLQEHQSLLQTQMAALPEKWVTEKMIDQEVELNKKMVEEVSKLVESKNIARNLELIQSAPLDFAIAPAQPEPPRLTLFLLVGLLFGTLFSSGAQILYTLNRGFPLTAANLSALGYSVLGALSRGYQSGNLQKVQERDLELFRKIINFLLADAPPQALLLGVEPRHDYSKEVAALMQKRGFRVLLVPVTQEVSSQREEGVAGGLFHYLEGKEALPQVVTLNGVDQILPGSASRFGQELISSTRFSDLIQELLRRYDFVIVVTHARLNSPEVEVLSRLVHRGVITLSGETLNDVEALKDTEKMAFLFS